MLSSTPLKFSSFFWAGFECTYALVENNNRLDMLRETKHDIYCKKDYQMIKKVGIKTVREGLAWNEIDKGNNVYDFSRFEKMMQIANEEGIEQIWDLNHFDFPKGIDPFSSKFITRFTEYAKKAVFVIRKYTKKTIYIAPINEISFFAWICADKGWWAPYKKGSKNGFRFKKQLVKATISAIREIKKIDHNVRFIHVDPFMKRKAKEPQTKKALKHVREFNEVIRFQAWDMISGKTYPELGGKPEYLDIIGVNYYFHNQEWVISNGKKPLAFNAMDFMDSNRISFVKMLEEIYKRYKRPMIVTETGSYGILRKKWWGRILNQIKEGSDYLPVYGVCAYPILDRPKHIGYLIPNSGLWDFYTEDPTLRRIPYNKALNIIKEFIKETKSVAKS